VNALQRVTAILERARVAGGWIDEEVAKAVLDALGLDEDGEPIDRALRSDAPTSE
jgi:hypothetical protein